MEHLPFRQLSLSTLVAFSLFMAAAEPAAASRHPETADVLCFPSDPYRPLAAEIAAGEGSSLFSSLDEVFADPPHFLIWVASPQAFSDRDVIEFGLAERKLGSMLAMGIITGETAEDARALWERRKQVKGDRVAWILGESPSAHRDGHMVLKDPERTEVKPLAFEAVRDALQWADYAAYQGHASPRALLLADEMPFRARDVPPVPPLVFAADACNTVRFWEEDSIALALLGRGAAGYTGFAYSPISSRMLGLPLEHSWPGFTVGHAAAVHARAAMRTSSRFRFYHLLGDPRVRLRKEPPCRIIEDREERGMRILRCVGAPPSVIPVRVPDGAVYGFVEIPAVASLAEGDLFQNVRLQSANIGPDKFILFVHPGGPFTVRLIRDPPGTWFLTDPVLRSLDNALVVNFDPQRGAGFICMGYGAVCGLVLSWFIRRRRLKEWRLWPGIVAGLDFVLLHALYAHFRYDNLTFIDFRVEFGWYALAGTFLIAFVGGTIFVNARKPRGRVLGLLAAALPFLGGSGILFVLLWFINARCADRIGAAIYNPALAVVNLIAALVLLLCFAAYFLVLHALVKRWPGAAFGNGSGHLSTEEEGSIVGPRHSNGE